MEKKDKPKKTTTAELESMRGKILHKFTSVEFVISVYICLYYFGLSNNFDFIHTVLYDKYMNIGIRLNIFEKILSKDTKNKAKNNKLISQIRELTRIRNIFAHCWVSSPAPETDEMYLIGSKSMKDIINVHEEYAKFFQIFQRTQKEVIDLCNNFKKGQTTAHNMG